MIYIIPISKPACANVKRGQIIYSDCYKRKCVRGTKKGCLTFCNSYTSYFLRVVDDGPHFYHPSHFYGFCDSCLYKSEKEKGLAKWEQSLRKIVQEKEQIEDAGK